MDYIYGQTVAQKTAICIWWGINKVYIQLDISLMQSLEKTFKIQAEE